MDTLSLELRKLGLTEKEVKIYLAGLELGPSSVQNIAQMVKIARPTTYEIIRKLEKKGLFSELKQKNKSYFSARPPESILGILRTQMRELEEKEREFIRIIAALESRYALRGESGIRTYRGKEGLKVLEEIFSFTSCSEIFVLTSGFDLKEIKKREEIYQKIRKRLGKIEVKEIYTKGRKLKSKLPQIKRKFLSPLETGGTLIIFDKAVFLPLKKQEGFLIKDQIIIDLLKSFFLCFWKLA